MYLKEEKRDLNARIAVFEERIVHTTASSDEKHHTMLVRLKSLDEELVATRASASTLKKQLDSANKAAREAREELESAKAKAKASADDNRRRLVAAESLIKQLYDHKSATEQALLSSPGEYSVRIETRSVAEGSPGAINTASSSPAVRLPPTPSPASSPKRLKSPHH